MTRKLKPISPGDILNEEFLEPLEISQNKLARDIDVPPTRINDILHNRRAITTDTALRLAVYFKTTPEFWLNLQNRYDLKVAEKTLKPQIERDVRPLERRSA
jgi:addiction module HigA family antidote